MGAAVLTASFLAACGGSSSGPPRTFVGTIDGTDARIALVVSGDGRPYGQDSEVGRGFLMGGPTAPPDLTEWDVLYTAGSKISSVKPGVGIDPQSVLEVVLKDH